MTIFESVPALTLVPCTSCHAEPGQPCRTSTGRVATEAHRARKEAAGDAHGCPSCRGLPGLPPGGHWSHCAEWGRPAPAAPAPAPAPRRRRRQDPPSGSLDDPTYRSMRARLAAYERWSRASEADRAEQVRKMHRGMQDRWERQVDPDGTLPHAERIKRAEAAKKAHMTRMSMQSRTKRKK